MHTNLTLKDAQVQYESGFSCVICMSAKLKMVYGKCQHRICADCLYNEAGYRKSPFNDCPICLEKFAFPLMRPNIPSDNIEMQRALGIIECQQENCTSQFWIWELPQHMEECHFDVDIALLDSPTRQSPQKSPGRSTSEKKTRQKRTRSPEPEVSHKVVTRSQTPKYRTRRLDSASS